MAIRVVYGDTGALGQLAVNAGQGEDFWRRFQAEQQLVQAQRIHNLDSAALANQAFALQQAAQGAYSPQQPGANQAQVVGAGRYAANNQLSVEAQRFNAQIQNMMKRGTINQSEADEVTANYLAGNRSPFSSLERDPAKATKPEDTLKYEVAEVKARRAAAEAKIQQLEMQIESAGGLATPEQQALMDQYFNEIVETHKAEGAANSRRMTGALPGGAAGTAPAPEGTTIVGAGGQTLVKRNGRWEPQ